MFHPGVRSVLIGSYRAISNIRWGPWGYLEKSHPCNFSKCSLGHPVFPTRLRLPGCAGCCDSGIVGTAASPPGPRARIFYAGYPEGFGLPQCVRRVPRHRATGR